MKVHKTHFTDTFPGQPIYEMPGGELRLPFPNPQSGLTMWLTEKEARGAVKKKTPENDNAIIQLFVGVKNEIEGIKPTILNLEGKNPGLKAVN